MQNYTDFTPQTGLDAALAALTGLLPDRAELLDTLAAEDGGWTLEQLAEQYPDDAVRLAGLLPPDQLHQLLTRHPEHACYVTDLLSEDTWRALRTADPAECFLSAMAAGGGHAPPEVQEWYAEHHPFEAVTERPEDLPPALVRRAALRVLVDPTTFGLATDDPMLRSIGALLG